MKTQKELQKIVQEGLEVLKKEEGLLEGVVYASSSKETIGRLVYTTHIPSNGLEEPKSSEEFGLSVDIWFEKNGRKLLGSGFEPNDFSVTAVKRAIEKAKRDAVEDKEFYGFLKPADAKVMAGKQESKTKQIKFPSMTAEEEALFLAKISWETIRGAVDVIEDYRKKNKLSLKNLAFILNGDNYITHEAIAFATTNGISASDESASIFSFITAMLEKEAAKGSSWDAAAFSSSFSGYEVGKQAAEAAIHSIGGVRVPTDNYTVVFGHQAVTELFGNLYLSHMNLAMVDFGASMYLGKYGQEVASSLLTMYDDATLKNGPASKTITCEGYPTGKTELVTNGKLVGYLSNSQITNKILHKGKAATPLFGKDPKELAKAIAPKNGFRFTDNAVRNAASGIGIHATNLMIESSKKETEQEVLKGVKNGIFIGRLWYTYPIGGYSSGIITGTAVADCFVIRDGKLAEPILPNTLRLEDNIGKMVRDIVGIVDNKRATILWNSDTVVYAPWVAMKNVRFVEIGKSK